MPQPHAPYEEPLSFAVVELTNRCNLRCAHCASVSGEAREDELSTAEWCAVFEALAELGCAEVTLLGGEPFLHPDWVQLAKAARAAGVEPTMVTNGLVQPDRVLPGIAAAELRLIGVSLDAATPETYRAVRGVDAFERVLRFIEALRDRSDAHVVGITSFSRLNLHEIEDIAALIQRLGVTWQVQFVHAISERFDQSLMISPEQHAAACRRIGEWLIESLDAPWIATMDDFGYYPLDPVHAPLHCGWAGCQAGQSVIGVRANGDVIGCLSLGDPFIEDNLRRRPLQEIWRAPERFVRFRQKGAALEGACAACPRGELCRAGCSAMAWASTGGLGENPYCMRRDECEGLRGQLRALGMLATPTIE